MRHIIAAALLIPLCVGAPALAQGAKTSPPPATKTAPAPTKTVPTATKAAPGTKTVPSAVQTKQDTKAAPATKGQAPGAAAAAPPTVPTTPPIIMREVFDYDAGGRRDPFFSLLTTAELRPTITDLKLVGILYDESGVRPVAILRDISAGNTQYRVTIGSVLGRLRVALIKRKSVIFSIEEFGLNRQDSLVMGDTSKARAR